ncbi:unnamed protein product [Calypogeia fissa]
MDNYGNDYFMSQEGYASIDFTLLDRPNSNIASAPESTAALLPDLHVGDSSFASFDFLDAPNVDAFGGVLPDEAHSRDQGGYRYDQQKKTKERSLLQQSPVGLHRGDGDADSELPSSEFHIPFEVQKPISNLDFFSQGHTKESGHQEQQTQSDPGNDATDGNQDYFEPGQMSQQAHNAAGAGGWYNSWPGSNSQGDQTQVFLQPPAYEEASDERRLMQMKGNTAQLAGQMGYQSSQVPNTDSVPKATHSFLQTTHPFLPTAKQNDSRQASNTGLGLPSAQVNATNSSVVKNSSRHQAYDYDGLMNGASANQFRVTSAVENTSSARRHQGSDANVGGQDALRGHAQSQSYKYTGQNLGTMAQVEVPPLKVNDYDFLGGQYAMKGQSQGSEIGQQLAVDEMQAWHQHPLLSQSNQQQTSYQQSYQDLPRQHQQHHVDQQSQSARQQHFQQFLAANHQNQSLGNQLSAFLTESSLQDIPRVAERQNSQLAVDNSRALLQTSYLATNNAANVNWSASDPSAMEGLAHDYLMGADQNFNWQALALKASQQVGPNAYGSLPVTRRDSTGQASGGTYAAMQGGFQDYYAGAGKLTTANAQVEKPVARNLGAEGSGGSMYGGAYQTTEVYDSTAGLHASAQGSKHQAIGKLPFWQNPYPQTVEQNRSGNNLGQTNLPPRSPQVPAAAQGRQQSNWSGLSGQQETLHGGIFAQNLANAEALKQSLLAGSSIQQNSHQAADLRPSTRNQSIEAPHYMQQSSTQAASGSQFLSALGAKQGSTWNRLNMPQNVSQTGVSAESPSSLEASQKSNWTSLNIHQAGAETQSLANLKQQNVWGGHTAQRSRPAANSLHLFTDVDARRSSMQNSHDLQQGSAQPSGTQQAGKIDVNMQSSHNIQPSSVQGNDPPNTLLDLETSQQSGWRDHSLLQGANQTNSSLQGYSDLDKTSSWRNIWQTPSSGEASSQLLDMDDGRQQNTLWGHSLQKSRPEPVESHVPAINPREQSAWSGQDVQQESPQTNQLLSSLEAEQQQGSHHSHTLGDRHQAGQYSHLLHEERAHLKASAEVDARHNATQSVYSLQSQVAATEQDVRQKAMQNAYNLQSQVGMRETDARHKANQDVYSLQTQIRVGEADNRSKTSAYNLQAQLASADAEARHRASQQNPYALQAQVAMGETDVRHKANQNIYNLQSQVGMAEKDSRHRGSQNVYNLQSQVGSVETDAQLKARQNAYNLSQVASAEAEARLKASQNAYSLQAQVGAYSQTTSMDGRHSRSQWPLGSQQQGNSQSGTSMFGFPGRSGKNQNSQNSSNLQTWNPSVSHVEGWQKSGAGGSTPFQQADLMQVENVDSRQQTTQSGSTSRHSSPQNENHLQSLSSSRPPSRLGRSNNALDSSLSGAMGPTTAKLTPVNHWQNHNNNISSSNSQGDALPSWSQGHASPARGDVEKFNAAADSAPGRGDVFPQWSRGQSLHSQHDVEQVNLVGESNSGANEVLPTWSRGQNLPARKDVEHSILGGESRIHTNDSQQPWSSGQDMLAQNNVEESSSGLNETSTTWSRQQNVAARKTVEQPNLGELNSEMNENDLPAWSRGQSAYTRKDEDDMDGDEESNRAAEELPIWSRGQNKSTRSVVDQLDLGEESNSARNDILPGWSRGQATPATKETEQPNIAEETNSGSDLVPTWSRGQSAPAVRDAEELNVEAESNIGKPDALPGWSQGQHVSSRSDDEQLNQVGDPNSGGTNRSVKESLIARPEAEKRAQAEMSFLDRGIVRESNSGASPAPSPENNLFSSSAKQKSSAKTSSLSRNTLELLSRPEEPNESSSMQDEEVEEEEVDLEDSGVNASGISLAHLRRPGQPSGPLSPQGFGLRLAPPSHLSQRGDASRMMPTLLGQELPQSNSNSENDQALNEKVDPSVPSEVDTSGVAPATSTGTDMPANSQQDSQPRSQEHVPAEVIEHSSLPSSQEARLSASQANQGVHQAFLGGQHSVEAGQQGLGSDVAPAQGMDPTVSEDGNGTSNSYGSSQATLMGHLTSSLPQKAQHSPTNLQIPQSGGVQTAGLSKLLNTFKDSLAGQNKQVPGQQQQQQQAGNAERGNTGVFESFRPQFGKQVNGLQPGQWGTVFQRLAAQVQNKPNQAGFGQMQSNNNLEQANTASESFAGKTGAPGHYFSGHGFAQGQVFPGQATSSGQPQPGQPLNQGQTVPGQETTAAAPHSGQIYNQGYSQSVQGLTMDKSHQGYLQTQSHTIQAQGMLPEQHPMVPSPNHSAQVITPGQSSYPGQAYAPGQVIPGHLNAAGRSYPGQAYNSSQGHPALGSGPGKSFSQSHNYSGQPVNPGQALPGPETPGQPIPGHLMSPAMASKQNKARQNRKLPQKPAGNDANQTPMQGGYPAQQSTGFQSQQSSPAQSISVEHQYGPMAQQKELSSSVQPSQEETPSSDAPPESLAPPEGLGSMDARDGDSRGLGGTDKPGTMPVRAEAMDSVHAPPRSSLEQYGLRQDNQGSLLQQWQNAQAMNSQSGLSEYQFQRILEARPSLAAALDTYKGNPRLYQMASAQLRASLNAAHMARLGQYQQQVRDQQAGAPSTGVVRTPSDGSVAAQAAQASQVAQAAHAQAQSMHASQAAQVHAAAQAVEAFQAAQAAQKAQAVQAAQAAQAMHAAQAAQSGQSGDQAAQAVQAALMSKNASNAQAAQAARLQYLSQLAQRGQSVNGMAAPWYSGMVGRPGSNGPLLPSRMVEGTGQDPNAASAPFGVGNDGLFGNRFLPNSHVPPPQPKKRKEIPALPPWREVISQAGGYVSNMSGSELEWAAAANRIPEVEPRDEILDVTDSRSVIISRAKRRLRLTTQLMQQITPAVPATFMQSKAIEDRESASYTLSKLAFADACRISSIARRIREVAAARDAEESRIEKERELAMKEAEKSGENTGRPLPLPTNIADRFKLRMKLLENDLQRLENSPSAVDLVKDMQDTERISLVNRLAVHHSPHYSQQNSDSPMRAVPHKYVTKVQMPSKLPEGLLCVSL